mmetsp:Transcript_22510/g.45931  ORF Transcript_22510/g.45931 Transcript_22510/m.45931 type:complete len:268 (+) Transcript_22510:244-1047(+)
MFLARRRLAQAAGGVVFLASARLATAAAEAPAPAPPSGIKTLHFLRHGQAEHNPRAEAARAAGCSFDDFLRLMMEDDAFDAALTDLGRQQGREAAARLGNSMDGVELVVCSPLSRALDTATLVLPGPTARGPFLAHDDLRERSGWMLNAKRRTRAELDARPPPAVDTRTALWSEADELWQPDELEPTAACAERGYQLLRWISEERTEAEVAVVGHGGLFAYLLNEHPKVHALDTRASARFENCELRTLRLTWTGSGDARVFELCSVG